MAGFDASQVVEALAYTFKPFLNQEGVIREPTDQQISDFLAGMKALTLEMRDEIPQLKDTDPEDIDLLGAMESLDPEMTIHMASKLSVVYEALCSGKPSKEDLLRLPPRIRNVFYAWLQKQVMDPEVKTGAGT